jgi:hypothetical protein
VKDNQLAELDDQNQQEIIVSNKINDDNSITSSLTPSIQSNLTVMKDSNNYDSKTVTAINDNNDKKNDKNENNNDNNDNNDKSDGHK